MAARGRSGRRSSASRRTSSAARRRVALGGRRWPTRLRAVQPDLHRLRGHGAGGRDGRVVMAAMDVGWSDLGSWTALLAALGAAGSRAASSRPASRPTPAPDDLVVHRVDGRLVVARRPRAVSIDRGAADRPPRAGRAATRAVVEALLDRCRRSGGSSVTDHRARPRHRPGSSSARTAGGPRSPTTSRSRTSVAAPTAWPATSSSAASRRRASSSPTTAGSRRSTSRPRPPRSSSPTTSRSPTPPTPCRPR